MLKSLISSRKSASDDVSRAKAAVSEIRKAGGGGFGLLKFEKKKFVTPFKNKNSETSLLGRKRKRVDYSAMGGGGGGGSDDEDADLNDEGNDKENGKAKKAKKVKATPMFNSKGIGPNGESLIKVDRKKIEVTIKEGQIHKEFAPPTRYKDGKPLATSRSFHVLGTRLSTDITPRPLHPMSSTSIVLFDPTVDDVEAQREKDRLQKIRQEAEEQLEAAEREDDKAGHKSQVSDDSKKSNVADPKIHKSLAEILNIRKRDPGVVVKVPVIIDPDLTKILRPHQVEGVKFLYRCSTGLVQENVFGSIMADGMGLGKTLQCIALMWTLLKQSPIPRKSTIEKCIIACPSTLVRNWANELAKWLGDRAPSCLVIDGTQSKEAMVASVHRWCNTRGKSVTQPVMIVSYETLRNLIETLGEAEVGLLLCDEGHRLKNSDSLTFRALDTIKVKRRIILSGTPIQNDLTEYFALLSFANPALLGNRQQFHKNFEMAILRGRDSDATDAEKTKGDEKLKELSTLVSKFIIRRSNELNTKYLPTKYEHVVFCRLSAFQRKLYDYFLKSDNVKSLLHGRGSQPLRTINLLKKMCNHPDLIDFTDEFDGAEKYFPEGYKPGVTRYVDSSLSGKFVVLERFLREIRATSDDKVVLISNYTQTLDLFDRMCRANNWGMFRLDGTVAGKKRQKYVDQFNDPERKEFVFLLSSKAGGCGINLIGANRLILFDPDWNPASDQQALARVWREGQKKECFVYRFISTGSIEEKILQRQLSKQALSKCVVDDAQDQERHFSASELRELFAFKADTSCDSHDTLKCKRCKDGRQIKESGAMLNEDVSSWNHVSRDELMLLQDDLLRREVAHEEVSFVFQFCSV